MADIKNIEETPEEAQARADRAEQKLKQPSA
jgi:hypothetical protein